jgi:hypothetical protein
MINLIKKLPSVATCAILLAGMGSAQTASFKVFNVKDKVTPGWCHMGECSLSKSVATRVIQKTPQQIILDVVLLGGTSTEGRAKIRWNKKPHKITIVCSYSHPSIALGSQLDELPLNRNATWPGYLESSINLYFRYCHSDTSDAEVAIKKFGYNVQVPEND